MIRQVELFAVIHFTVMGLSHIVMRRVWAELFVILGRQGRAGAFAHGFLSLFFGSIVVAFHNVWSGLPAVLTVVGWAYLVKAALCFLAPGLQARSLARVSPARDWEFILPGAAYLIVAGLLIWSLTVPAT